MRTRQNVLEYDVTLSEKSLTLAYRSYFVTHFWMGLHDSTAKSRLGTRFEQTFCTQETPHPSLGSEVLSYYFLLNVCVKKNLRCDDVFYRFATFQKNILPSSLDPKNIAVRSYQTIRWYIPGDGTLGSYCRENLSLTVHIVTCPGFRD
jgi:hypothetical protein